MAGGQKKAAGKVQELSQLQVKVLVKSKEAFSVMRSLHAKNIFVQLSFFSIRTKERGVIQGSMALSNWPEVLHFCLDSPVTLSAEEVTEGLWINNKRYGFNGLVHSRGDGVWNVSVKRTVAACEHRGWNLVDRGSVRKHTNHQELLSQVVMVQLTEEKNRSSRSGGGQEEDRQEARGASAQQVGF